MDIFRVRVRATEGYLKILEHSFSVEWGLQFELLRRADDWVAELALIHPEHFFDIKNSQNNCLVRGGRYFEKELAMSARKCGCDRVWEYDCPIHAGGESLAADHLFPFSFGGPTKPSNKIYLCARHNAMKGSDLHFFPWEKGRPDWLKSLVKTVAELKGV